jgi:hypothetical protein
VTAVEEIRRAAALMRERAQDADKDSFGSWHGIGTGYRADIKEHIASWHPSVALAVADWLDHVAGAHDRFGQIAAGALVTPDRLATAVARAYLAGEQP